MSLFRLGRAWCDLEAVGVITRDLDSESRMPAGAACVIGSGTGDVDAETLLRLGSGHLMRVKLSSEQDYFGPRLCPQICKGEFRVRPVKEDRVKRVVPGREPDVDS